MIEFLGLNKQKNSEVKTQDQILLTMFIICFIVNIPLLVLSFLTKKWLIIIGFNYGFITGIIGFFMLLYSVKILSSESSSKALFRYLTFLLRLSVYGAALILVIIFKFANILSVIGGFSIMMVATILSEIWQIIKNKSKIVKKEVKNEPISL